MSDNLSKKELKNQKKQKKIAAKLDKIDAKQKKSDEPKSLKALKKETKKTIRVKKEKDPKDKINMKLATREFPVKLVKEVNKIKWSSSKNLTNKYITVLIFMIITAIMFFLIDMGLQQLFSLIKVL
ncbi:preprotein translocase subunit SecE [Williamsoniiplasma lucivorax]|uniref:Preprotein translocase subunit SecE n=1 Tax=Williamsoniiplasma lucivorax TaxID=209274 RepID=A0A2S5REX6_9MOLU|nr:preprotein translocase subunit SecE [Williamsoniiplasma lucivorax]PPE05860.1 preprotein translocase subunit SecE [Williamsoniiplasma lucivorax]